MRYYELFDMLRRKHLNMGFLRTFLSGPTVTKLNKGENVTTDVIERICYVLNCQPKDIMEMESEEYDNWESCPDERLQKAREFISNLTEYND